MTEETMTSGRIPTGTIVLMLLLQVGHPLVDTCTDIMWLNTLLNFGKEWSYFNVSTFGKFVVFTEDCIKSQYCNGNYDGSNCDGNWINKTVNRQTLEAFDVTKFYQHQNIREAFNKHVSNEKVAEFINGQTVITKQTGSKAARCRKGYIQWFLVSLVPLVICGLCTLVVWWREEEGWTKVLLLPVVFIGLYSQYKAVKIILIGLGKWPNRRIKDWKKEKGKFSRGIASIGTMYNSLLSLLILVALFSSENLVTFSGKRPNPLIDNNQALFFTKFSISLLLTVMGLTHLLKDGPGPLISSKQGYLEGFISWDFLVLFLTNLTWLVAKSLILFGVIAAQGDSSIAGIEVLNKSTHVKTIFWVSTLILPQFLHAIIVLAISTRWKVFSFIDSFPSFIITPIFTPFTYKGSCSDGTFEFRVSIGHTKVNIRLTFLFTLLTMFLYYAKEVWESLYNFGLTPQQSSDMQTEIKFLQENNATVVEKKVQDIFDEATEYMQVYLVMIVIVPYIVLVLSLLPACHLINNCFRGGHSANLKFCKTGGSFTWKILSEEYNALEIVAEHGADLQDQQTGKLVENNTDLSNNKNQENVEDNMDNDKGENNLNIQNHDNHDSQEGGPEQINNGFHVTS